MSGRKNARNVKKEPNPSLGSAARKTTENGRNFTGGAEHERKQQGKVVGCASNERGKWGGGKN